MIIRSLATLLLAVGLAFGQQPAKKEAPPKEPAKPAPGSLEDTLEKSLRNSADIKAAEAKVRDAEAELNKVRHHVLTKATALHSDLNLAKRILALLEAGYREQERVYKLGAVNQEALIAAQAPLEKQRGEIEKLEAELKSLRGEFAIKSLSQAAFSPDGRRLYTAELDGALRIWDIYSGKMLADPDIAWLYRPGKPPAVQTPMTDRVQKLLDQEIEWKANDLDLSDMFKWLLDAAKTDIPYRDLLGPSKALITLSGKMPLGAWFQALEDSDPNVAIVVRDYGLLMTRKDRVPPGAMGVSELWKAYELKPKQGPKVEKK